MLFDGFVQLLVHRFLDFRQLGFVSLADFFQLGFHHGTGDFELGRDLLAGFALACRQRQPQLPLVTRQDGAELFRRHVEAAAQLGQASDILRLRGAHGRSGRFRLAAHARQRLLCQQPQSFHPPSLPHDQEHRDQGGDGGDYRGDLKEQL